METDRGDYFYIYIKPASLSLFILYKLLEPVHSRNNDVNNYCKIVMYI